MIGKLSLFNKKICYYLYMNKYFQIILSILSVVIMMGYSIKGLILNEGFSVFYDVFTCICIVVFLLEIYINLMVELNYFLSFFFWLDLISVLIFVLDLSFYERWLYYNYNSSGSTGFQLFKIVYVIRLVRITRFIKFLSSVELKKSVWEQQ